MQNRDARIAGFLYLIAIIVGFLTLQYLPETVIQPGDAIATAHNIAANQFRFRLLIVGDIAAGTVWLFVVLALYRLLKGVDPEQAALMVVLGAFMQVPLYFVGVVNYAGALLSVTDTSFLSVFSTAQRDALAMLFLRLHHYQFQASLIFAGLWLFPFGILVFKSRFLPRTLGVLLIINGFAWLAISLTSFLIPQYGAVVDKVTSPMLFGEFAVTLWLLIVGARTLGPFRKSVG